MQWHGWSLRKNVFANGTGCLIRNRNWLTFTSTWVYFCLFFVGLPGARLFSFLFFFNFVCLCTVSCAQCCPSELTFLITLSAIISLMLDFRRSLLLCISILQIQSLNPEQICFRKSNLNEISHNYIKVIIDMYLILAKFTFK
jgi:hypothetical protein